MNYNQDLKNNKILISKENLGLLKSLNRELGLYELMEDKITLHRLGLDYIYASVIDEGNTYTLSGLQTLVERNIPSSSNTSNEALMILNVNQSLHYVLEDYSTELNKRLVSDLHSILASGLVHYSDVGKIRNRPVYITGSTYEPASGESFITAELEEIINISKTIEEPFEKAIYLNINLCYLQPFVDLNKRTARTVQTYSMLQGGVVPLFINSDTIDGFRESLKYYYEEGNYEPYVEWFVQAYIKMYRKLVGTKVVDSLKGQPLLKRINLFDDNEGK